ncbi:hypothetical protein AAFF_G00236900 [Aldrovandia affinis]|uniref:Uncharacterized protein n=1 Tax=Aldrovandia affinis TaxID=143900 RepID=A0AAD7W4M0_9TELE|nr:hypothetical protein AAFF_G00236900 [Aldrovandia affinis]
MGSPTSSRWSTEPPGGWRPSHCLQQCLPTWLGHTSAPGLPGSALRLTSPPTRGRTAADDVFIRHNTHQGPLQSPYDGPLSFLQTADKTFVADVGGVDRLKPAHLDLDRPIRLAQTPRRGRPPDVTPSACPQAPRDPPVSAQGFQTRCGHMVRGPQRLTLPVLVNSGGTYVGNTAL